MELKKFKKLNEAINKKEQDEYIYGKDKEPQIIKNKMREGMKEFIVATREEMYEYMLSLNGKEWNFYEYPMDMNVCLFLDVDMKRREDTGDEKVILNNILEKIIEILDKYGIKVFLKDFLIQCGSREDKISYHIKCKKIKFNDVIHQKNFWQTHCNDFNEIDENIPDMAVYRLNVPLKMVWCHKWKSNEKIHKTIPINGDKINLKNFNKYSITYFEGNEITFPEMYMTNELNILTKNKKGKQQKNQVKKKLKKENENKYSNYEPNYPVSEIKEPMEQLNVLRALNYGLWIEVGMALKVLWGRNNKDEYYKTWLEFSRQSKEYDEDECEYLWNYFKTEKEANRYLFGKASIIKWAMNDNNLYRYTEPLRDVFYETKENNFYGMEVVYINERYLPDLELFPTLIVKSGQGTDKTGKIIKLVSKIEDKISSKGLLCCITRRNLSTTITSKSKEGYYGYKEGDNLVRIVDYKDVKRTQYSDIKNLAITPNSLIHLVNKNKIPRKTFLWIDEITPFLHYLPSNNLIGRRNAVLSILEWYIKNVDYLLVTDADIDDDAIKIIMSIRNEKTRMIWNKYKADKSEYQFIKSYQGLINRVKKLLRDGKNVYLCCDTMNVTKKMAKYFKDYKPLVYNSESDKNTRDKLKDINNNWKEERLIITNSVNEYGVSFDDLSDPHFHTIFAIFKGNTITAQGANQLLHRVRHTRTKSIYIHLEKSRPTYYETELNEIRAIIEQGENEIKRITGIEGVKDEVYKIDENGNIKREKELIYEEILVRTLRTKYESLNQFDKWLKYYIEEGGGKIVPCDEIDDFPDELEEMDIYEDDVDNIFNSINYTSNDVERLHNEEDYTKEEVFGLKKYYMKKKLGMIKLTKELIYFCIKNNLHEQMTNFRMFYDGKLEKRIKDELIEEDMKSLGMNSRYMKFLILDKMMKIIGWNKEDFDFVMEYKSGKNKEKGNKELIKYYYENRKLINYIYGNVGRLRGKDICVLDVVDMMRRMINDIFGYNILKKIIERYRECKDVNYKNIFFWNINNKNFETFGDRNTKILQGSSPNVTLHKSKKSKIKSGANVITDDELLTLEKLQNFSSEEFKLDEIRDKKLVISLEDQMELWACSLIQSNRTRRVPKVLEEYMEKNEMNSRLSELTGIEGTIKKYFEDL